MRYAAALAAIPLLAFGAVAVSRPTPVPPPIAPVRVQTESVRMIRMDTQTFRARWRPLYDVPPATVLQPRGGDAQPREAMSAPVEVARLPPAARRIVKRASLRPTDICARHNMRKQFYRGRGGWQHWRCRR